MGLVLCQNHTVFIIIILEFSKIWNGEISSDFFLIRIVLAILDILYLIMKFDIIFPISIKNHTGNWVGIVLNL